jgi:hypothetical protein
VSLIGRLTRQLASKGIKNATDMAHGLLRKYGEVDAKGKLTEKGKQRQRLGKAGRAKDRAAKYSGNKPSDYKYNVRTNRAIKK